MSTWADEPWTITLNPAPAWWNKNRYRWGIRPNGRGLMMERPLNWRGYAVSKAAAAKAAQRIEAERRRTQRLRLLGEA